MATVKWPAENAKLLDVSGPGAPDAYADVASAGLSIWAGSIGAVLKRERRAYETDGVMTTIEQDVLVVRKPPAAIIGITPGDEQSAHTVLVEDRRGSTPYPQIRWHVVNVENRATGHEADSLHLVLRDPR